MRCEPQSGADQLAPHAFRFELVAGPEPLAFPPLCPNCGRSTQRSLTYAKVFYGQPGDDWMDQRHVQHATVPFCAACITRHQAEQWQPSRFEILLSLASENLLAAFGTAGVAVFVLILVPDLALRGKFSPGTLFPLGLALLFALISLTLVRSAWRQTAHRRVPAQTSVTTAFDFSDDISKPLEAPRHVYTVCDAAFAEPFDALNKTKVWSSGGPAAVDAKRKDRWLVWAGLAAIVIFALGNLFGSW